MYLVSKHVLWVLNLSLLLISVPLAAITATKSNVEKIDCVGVVQQPLLVIGILLCLLSVMGILSYCFRSAAYLWLYLFFLLLLMIGVFCFTMFLFLVTDVNTGLALRDTGFMRSDRASYQPSWLHIQLGNVNKWVKIRNCMRTGNVCGRGPSVTLTFVSPDLMDGCCTPPRPCGFKPINATSLRSEGKLINVTTWSSEGVMHPLEGDCKKWSNEPGVLCYECETCKGAIIQDLQDGWRRMTAAAFLILVLLNVIFAVGSCAYKDLQLDKYPSQIYRY